MFGNCFINNELCIMRGGHDHISKISVALLYNTLVLGRLGSLIRFHLGYKRDCFSVLNINKFGI